MTKQQETTELAIFPKLNLPSVTGITEEMNKSFGTMYTRIEAGIADLPTDMTVKANREKVASYAYSISRTKTGLDEAAAGVSSEAKQIVDAVNGERRQLKNTLDILRDKARAPLDAWEAKEAERKHLVQSAVDFLEGVHVYQDIEEANSTIIQQDWAALEKKEFTAEKYGEDAGMLSELKTIALDRLDRLYKSHLKAEQEAAELEQLRREKAERDAAEAARIAEEERKAAEEARVAREAEERAEAARLAEERVNAVKATNYRQTMDSFTRVIERAASATSWQIVTFIETADELEITDERYPANKIGELSNARSTTVAKLKEMSIQRANEESEAEKRRAIEAEEQRKEADARAEEQARLREEQAKQAERDRIAREQAAQDQADRERAADIAHRKRLNSEAVAALMKTAGITEKEAQAVVIAIYKEQVPHVSIRY